MPICNRRFILAQVIDELQTRRRRRYRQVVVYLINSGSISLFLHRIRRVLSYNSSDFSLDDYTEDWCIEYLRFSSSEIQELLPFLRLDLVP